MALRIRKDGDSGRGGLVADRRLYRRADGTPCERGDPRSAFLLAGKGSRIPGEYVERYDMRMEDGRVTWGARASVPEPDPPPEEEEVEEVQEEDPPEAAEPPQKDEEAPAPPVSLGGGWWKLHDGSKVRTSDLPNTPEPDGGG